MTLALILKTIDRILTRLSGVAALLPGLLILSSVLLLLTACKSGYPPSGKLDRAGATSDEPKQVKTALVTEVTMKRSVIATGMLAALEDSTVSGKVAGRLSSISVDLGSRVHKGQPIAQLEPQDYKLRLQQAEAALAQARARVGLPPDGSKDEKINVEETGTVRQARAVLEEAALKRDRFSKLLQQGVISKAEVDTAEAAYKVAQSRLQDAIEEIRNREAVIMQRRSEVQLARQQLADTTINAPFEGIVQQRQADLGEYLAVGAPIVTVVRMDPLRLRAEVPEREAHAIQAGQEVRVTVEGDPNIYSGQIARLSPTITAQNRILIVEAEVRNNGQLRPGSFARAEIVTDAGGKAVAVPASAVVTFAGIEKVIAIEDGKTIERRIKIGRKTNEWIEVLSGVKVGDVVLIDPGNLQSGQPVTVAE